MNAFCFIATEDYLDGLMVLLKSLKKNFKNYEQYDKIVYSNKPLKIDGATVKVVNEELIKLCPYYWKFSMFLEDQYDKLVWMDSDMLCIRDFSFIDGMNIGIGVCHEMKTIKKDKFFPINTGLMVLGKSILTKENYRTLMRSIREEDSRHTFDQEVFNRFFAGMDVTYLPFGLNTTLFDRIDGDTCNVHWARYYLLKPWVKDVDGFIKGKSWLSGHFDSAKDLYRREVLLYESNVKSSKYDPNSVWKEYRDS